ncbi:hypothetical protein SDRG_15431 [Saprolegnia diclina VS20]|uniref:F-box domain-containing protein n=1 Tax=Saprolegnia diclina (strain VS20) TaxID=1156394 RepID=T0PWZ8_SAPDV|nr:hypothetical protein SDRG_15431 [Saprolegnia diclina VS20]EQC26781.1 hypothetical protein SDRG_15431 [Saprolegnia diclina VS20]|eukprot:XP_008619824.1 hypothetical protein SDRG_15431 [Saprolegnia diclina VS20]
MHFDVAAFATVLPFLPPSLRHVMFVDSNDDGDILVESNLAPSLQQWLGNGRLKKHINFSCKLAKDDAAAVADVLASALSVTTLEMTSSHELVKALIASTKPLSHVTRFGVRRVPTNDAKLLVARLSLHHLTRLKVEASVKDLTWVLHLLPSMPHLQELLLGFGMLHEAPDTLGASRLRKLALNHVQLSDKAFNALLKWTSGLQQLQAAVFRGLSLNGKWFSLQQMMRHHWLVTAGSCALIQDGQALVSPPSLQGLAIHPDTVEALVRALSRVVHTTVVRLATDINTDTYNEAARRAWMDFGVAMLPREYNEYDLSPPQSMPTVSPKAPQCLRVL